MGHAVDKDLLTLLRQNVNDKFASVQKQVALFEEWQLCQGTTLDRHDEELMQQQKNVQEVKETLERLSRCQKAINERLSMQVHALRKGLAKTDDKVEQLEQGLTARTDKVEHKVEQLEQGLSAITDKVEHKVEQLGLTAMTDKLELLDQEVESGLNVKDVKPSKLTRNVYSKQYSLQKRSRKRHLIPRIYELTDFHLVLLTRYFPSENETNWVTCV